MVKIKHRRTVDCVVGGYRLHRDGKRVGSLLLGLYNPHGRVALHRPLLLLQRGRGRRASRGAAAPPTRARASRPGRFRRARPSARGPPAAGAADKELDFIPVRPILVARGELRSADRRPLSPRHPLRTLAPGQGSSRLHSGTTRAPGRSDPRRGAAPRPPGRTPDRVTGSDALRLTREIARTA